VVNSAWQLPAEGGDPTLPAGTQAGTDAPEDATTAGADVQTNATPAGADAQARPAVGGRSAADVLRELKRLDLAVYRAVERTRTPVIDKPLRELSRLANHSKLWLAVAAPLFVFGGRSGRRAALTGAVAIGVNSFVVNVPLKAIARRPRPDRESTGNINERHVRMPTSRSFPSGHSASAFAFATAVAAFRPELGMGLRGLAAVVAYSRVHSGVHYPGDVLAGSLIGIGIGESTALTAKSLLKHKT
jgi:membrane-associated phospholipid phosphatase